jgi:hypothetical protein
MPELVRSRLARRYIKKAYSKFAEYAYYFKQDKAVMTQTDAQWQVSLIQSAY